MNNTEEKTKIIYNVELLKYYRNEKALKDLIRNEKLRQPLFDLLALAYMEDIYIFMRIMLYIANHRKKDVEEIFYKIVIVFFATMNTTIILANLDLFLKYGKYSDVLYFLQCPQLTKQIQKYITHKSKNIKEFKVLLSGKVPNCKINRIMFTNKMPNLFYQILDEPRFNGLIA